MYLFCLLSQTPIPTPDTIPSWAWAQAGIAGAIAFALIAIIRQMLSSFESRSDKQLVAYDSKFDKMLSTFKEDQKDERKRTDDLIRDERDRADSQHQQHVIALKEVTQALEMAKCKFTGQCAYQVYPPNRRPPEASDSI